MKIRTWKIVSILVMALLVVSIVGISCTKSPGQPTTGAAKTYALTFAHMRAAGGLEDVIFNKFAEAVAARTNGRIGVTIYPAQQLGDIYEVIPAVIDGTIDVSHGQLMDTYDPRLGAIWLYGLFLNDSDAKEAMFPGGWLYNILAPIAEEKQNVKVLGPALIGSVGMSNTKRPIRVPADVNGLKMRSAPVEAVKRQIGYLTPNMVTVAFGEVFSGLQLGTIDGSVNAPHTTYTFFVDVIKFYTHMKIHFEDNDFILNLDRWNSFPADLQTIFGEEAEKMSEELWNAIIAIEEDDLDAMEAKGVQVIRYDDLTEAERRAWIETARSNWPKLADMFGEDLMQKLQDGATEF